VLIRAFTQHDLAPLTELTVDTFRPFYEESFRPLMGEAIFAVQHGNWRDDYRKQVAKLHAPERHTYVAIAEAEGAIAGYVAWSVDPARKKGEITILAVSAQHRRQRVGKALCEHAFEQMQALGAEVVEIATGGDQFHPLTVYFRQL
jgi:ribosomal protein S18 acetylase RimI-like enzyme